MIIKFSVLKSYILNSIKKEIEPTWEGLCHYNALQEK